MTLRSAWRRRSRAFRIATGSIAVLASVVLLLWITRAQTTEWAIERFIDGFGLGPSDVKVTEVGLARADMTLVSSAAGTIRHIHVEYGIGDLLRGEVKRMVVDGARFRFAWKDGKLVPAITSSDGPISLPVERLEIRNSALTLDVNGEEIVADISGTVTGTSLDRRPGASASLDILDAEGSRVSLPPDARAGLSWIDAGLNVGVRAPFGQASGRIAALLAPNGDLIGDLALRDGTIAIGSVAANGLSGTLLVTTRDGLMDRLEAGLGFEDISARGSALGPGTLKASLRQPQGALHVALKSKPVSISVQADGAVPTAGVPFTMEGTADAGFVSALAGAEEPAAGGVHLRATGTAPPGPSLQGAFGAGLGDWLEKGKASGGIEATMARLRLPDTAAVDDAVVSMEVKLEGGALALTTPKGITVSGMSLDPSIAPKDSLFAGESSLSVAPAPGAPFLAVTPREGRDRLAVSGGITYETAALFVRGDVTGEATLDPAQWLSSARNEAARGSVSLQASLALRLPEGRSLPSTELTLDGDYDIGPSAVRLTADAGALTLRNAHWGERLALPGTSRLVLRRGAFYARDRNSGAVEASAVVEPFTWTAAMKRDGAEPARATIAAGRVALAMNGDGMKATLDAGRIEAPDNGVAARGIAATVTGDGDDVAIRASIADLRGTGEPALFPSLKARLDARIANSRTTFSAALTGAGDLLNLTAKGSHDLDSGKGGADFTLKPIDLSGEGTLKALSPRLAAGISKSGGTVSGSGAVHWGDGAAPGTLELAMKNVSLNGDSINVSALDGGVRLESLSPIRSAAGQRLSGVLQLPTVKEMPFDVRFRLDPGSLVVERATAKVFDGQFETEKAMIDTATGDGRVDLKISDVNLETAFTVLDLEQLKGTGRIGGMLPLTIADGRVKIEKGHLESTVAGTLQVGVDKLADQLQAYGENVDMAFRALTDFHYHRMVIDADKPFTGVGKAVFRLEGNNPKVMDGQPFVFNISLETDFDYLTSLLLELSGAANTALGWGARELSGK
ncbi:MAG: YdbH domain-containing protein [Sphingomonadales bacterium]